MTVRASRKAGVGRVHRPLARFRLMRHIVFSILAFAGIAMGIALGSSASSHSAPLAQAAENLDKAERIDLARPPDCPTTCRLNAIQRARPSLMLAGETAEVELSMRGICPGGDVISRIVFVVDPDAEMSRSELREVQSALRSLVQKMELDPGPPAILGLVSVGKKATVLSSLSSDSDRILAAIGRLEPDEDQALHFGMEEARQMIARSRIGDCDRAVGFSDIIVSFSSGISTRDCRPLARAARKAHSDGILNVAVCADWRCSDTRCLQKSVASYPRYFYEIKEADQIHRGLFRIVDEVINITLKQLRISIPLVEGMHFVPGSFNPEVTISDDGKHLLWSQTFVPKGRRDLYSRSCHCRADVILWPAISKSAGVTTKTAKVIRSSQPPGS